MPEQPPSFVVVDKRKFTMDGEIRENTASSDQERPAPARPAEPASGNVVTMPPRSNTPADDLAEESMGGSTSPLEASQTTLDADGDGPETESDLNIDSGLNDSGLNEDEFLAEPRTAEETAAQATAYKQSSTELDAMLQQANPGMQVPGDAGFEHLVQSFYLSAIMAMGAGTEPGQKPRIDILGARQAIDLLGVLEEKTRGNLSADEKQLLQGITFELRMTFLELTNAISKQAQQGPPKPPGILR